MNRSDYVVLIPAYNEARTIRAVAERVMAHGHRVIVIDDGSDDGRSIDGNAAAAAT